MKAFSITDIGERRQVNQDYVYCCECSIGSLPNLFIVADGMGGHNAGDYASRFSVEDFVSRVQECDIDSPVEVFQKVIQETNEALLKKAQEQIEYEGMGTTFVVATHVDHTLYVANVGDSRLYMMRDELHQVTKDHSLVEEMVRSGKLNACEAKTHPNKNIITRALGVKYTVEPDFFEIGTKPGDIVLMCSDGLTNMLDDSEIMNIIYREREHMDRAAKQLVEEANRHGGKDNIGVVLVKL